MVNPPVMLFCGYFYPRPPRGGRHHGLDAAPLGLVVISTHALREEGDLSSGSRA